MILDEAIITICVGLFSAQNIISCEQCKSLSCGARK